MSNNNDDNALDFFNELIDTQGVAVTTVSDGHVFGFMRKTLQAMLDQHPGQEKFIVFVKNKEFKD
jgi:hypothetical protein